MLKINEIKIEDYVYALFYSLSGDSTHFQCLAFPSGMEHFLSVPSGPLIVRKKQVSCVFKVSVLSLDALVVRFVSSFTCLSIEVKSPWTTEGHWRSRIRSVMG